MKPTPNDIEEMRSTINKLVNDITGMRWDVEFHLHSRDQDTLDWYSVAMRQGFSAGRGETCRWAQNSSGVVIYADIPGSPTSSTDTTPQDRLIVPEDEIPRIA